MKDKTNSKISILYVFLPALLIGLLSFTGCELFLPPGEEEWEKVSTPILTLPAGSYHEDISVTISCSTSGARIYYTTDGSLPETGSQEYSLPVTVAGDGSVMIINAIAVKNGMVNSDIACAAYIITYNRTDSPVFNPAGGTYTTNQNIILSCPTEGAAIYYTTDGTDPSTDSFLYSIPVDVYSTITIKAVAVKPGMKNSGLTTATYTIDPGKVSLPNFNPPPGEFSSPQNIEILCANDGAVIYFTVDGSDPDSSSGEYTGPVPINTTTTIKTIAIKDGFENSDIATGTFTIEKEDTATPTFDPVQGTYYSEINVSLHCTTAGAAVYYTTNGDNPTVSSPLYTGPVSVAATTTIKAFAVKEGMNDSSVNIADYVIKCTTPVFSPGSGTYEEYRDISITCATGGARIYYTTDNSNPSSEALEYGGTIRIHQSLTLKAIAVKTGFENSEIASGDYEITNPPVDIIWSRVDGIWGGTSFDMEIDPDNPSIVYSGTNNGIYKTTNGGTSWDRMNTNIGPFSNAWDCITDVLINPVDSTEIFVMCSSDTGGIYRSENSGDNWTLLPAFSGIGDLNSLAYDISTDIIYAAGGNLYKSSDNGFSWVKEKNEINKIFITSDAVKSLILGVDQSNDIFKYDSDNAVWTTITNNLPDSQRWHILTDPDDFDIIYVTIDSQIWKTINGGQIWYNTGMPGQQLDIDRNNTSVIYSIETNGVYKSINSASSFELIHGNNNNTGRNIIRISADSSNIYANMLKENYKSTDGGSSWQKINNGYIAYSVEDIDSSKNNNSLYFSTFAGNVFHGSSNGTIWEQKYHQFWGLKAISTDDSDSRIVFAEVDDWGILKSVNSFDSYFDCAPSFEKYNDFIIDSNIIYAASEESGVYKSGDSGNSWNNMSTGLSVPNIKSIAINSLNSNILYAGSNGGGLFKSGNGGTLWESESTGLTNWNIRKLAVNPDNPDIIYAGTGNGTGSFFKTTSAAEDWRLANTGLPANTDVYDISFDPVNSNILYIATDGGIYKSDDAAASWAYVPTDGFENLIPLCLEKRPEGLYAGTRNDGLLMGVQDGDGPVIPPFTGELLVNPGHPCPVSPYPLEIYDWFESDYHAGVSPGDRGAWCHSGDSVTLNFDVSQPGNYQLSIALHYSGAGQPAEDLEITLDPGSGIEKNFIIYDNNSIDGYTVSYLYAGILTAGTHILRFRGPNENQSIHVPWYLFELIN